MYLRGYLDKTPYYKSKCQHINLYYEVTHMQQHIYISTVHLTETGSFEIINDSNVLLFKKIF